MPAPSRQDIDCVTRECDRYRLACETCDREDHDGVRSLPRDWHGISRRQSLKDAMTTYDDHAPPPGYSVFDWWTHIGLCPDCQTDAAGRPVIATHERK